MKAHWFILPFLVLAMSGFARVHAQDMETLFDARVSHGGFGAPVVKFSGVNGSLGVWAGGRGAWVMNLDEIHAMSLGFGGYGLTTWHRLPGAEAAPNAEEDLYGMAGYGGFEIEYTNRSNRLVHVTVSSLIGAGGLMIRDRRFHEIDEDPNVFFVIEPGLQAEMNVTRFFRVGAGLSYRITSGVERGGFADRDFSGVNGVLTFKFGSFL